MSSKRLMTLNDSLDSIGWAKSYHVKDYHMREVKHERNGTGLFSISRRILQGSMIVRLNSLYKFSFIDLVINLIALRYRKSPKISPSKYKPPKIVTQKNHPLNRPSEYKPPPTPPPRGGGGLVFGICPLIQSKTKQKMVNFLPTTSQPNRFWNANFPPYISPEYKPLKKGLWKM